MSFDKHDCHYHQDIEYLSHPPNFLQSLYDQCPPTLTTTDLLYVTMVLPFLVVYISGITQQVVFLVPLLPLSLLLL